MKSFFYLIEIFEPRKIVQIYHDHCLVSFVYNDVKSENRNFYLFAYLLTEFKDEVFIDFRFIF